MLSKVITGINVFPEEFFAAFLACFASVYTSDQVYSIVSAAWVAYFVAIFTTLGYFVCVVLFDRLTLFWSTLIISALSGVLSNDFSIGVLTGLLSLTASLVRVKIRKIH